MGAIKTAVIIYIFWNINFSTKTIVKQWSDMKYTECRVHTCARYVVVSKFTYRSVRQFLDNKCKKIGCIRFTNTRWRQSRGGGALAFLRVHAWAPLFKIAGDRSSELINNNVLEGTLDDKNNMVLDGE